MQAFFQNTHKSRIRDMIVRSVIAAALLTAGPVAAADPAPLELVQTIVLKGKAGKLDHLALDAKRERLFLANTINGTLDVVDLKAGKLLKQVAGQSGIQGVAYAADLDRVFVGLGTGGYCNVFDGADYKPLKTVKFADDADNVKYDPVRGVVYVAHAEKALGIVDAKTFAVRADITLPGTAEGLLSSAKSSRLFVALPSPSEVVVVDPDKKEIVGSYAVKLAGGGHPIALDEANRRIFVGCRKAPMVVVLDAETGREITAAPIPDGVDDLFYDARHKRLFASCADGFIAVVRQVDADRYEPAGKLETAKNAKTCYFDQESGRLFLAVPRQSGKPGPEIRVYRVRD
jgi:hypothetical protein